MELNLGSEEDTENLITSVDDTALPETETAHNLGGNVERGMLEIETEVITLSDSDREDGEVHDDSFNPEDLEGYFCKFYLRGECSFGDQCRFYHMSDKGLYSMFERPNVMEQQRFAVDVQLPRLYSLYEHPIVIQQQQRSSRDVRSPRLYSMSNRRTVIQQKQWPAVNVRLPPPSFGYFQEVNFQPSGDEIETAWDRALKEAQKFFNVWRAPKGDQPVADGKSTAKALKNDAKSPSPKPVEKTKSLNQRRAPKGYQLIAGKKSTAKASKKDDKATSSKLVDKTKISNLWRAPKGDQLIAGEKSTAKASKNDAKALSPKPVDKTKIFNLWSAPKGDQPIAREISTAKASKNDAKTSSPKPVNKTKNFNLWKAQNGDQSITSGKPTAKALKTDGKEPSPKSVEKTKFFTCELPPVVKTSKPADKQSKTNSKKLKTTNTVSKSQPVQQNSNPIDYLRSSSKKWPPLTKRLPTTNSKEVGKKCSLSSDRQNSGRGRNRSCSLSFRSRGNNKRPSVALTPNSDTSSSTSDASVVRKRHSTVGSSSSQPVKQKSDPIDYLRFSSKKLPPLTKRLPTANSKEVRKKCRDRSLSSTAEDGQNSGRGRNRSRSLSFRSRGKNKRPSVALTPNSDTSSWTSDASVVRKRHSTVGSSSSQPVKQKSDPIDYLRFSSKKWPPLTKRLPTANSKEVRKKCRDRSLSSTAEDGQNSGRGRNRSRSLNLRSRGKNKRPSVALTPNSDTSSWTSDASVVSKRHSAVRSSSSETSSSSSCTSATSATRKRRSTVRSSKSCTSDCSAVAKRLSSPLPPRSPEASPWTPNYSVSRRVSLRGYREPSPKKTQSRWDYSINTDHRPPLQRKVCSYYIRGWCAFGRYCRFLHTPVRSFHAYDRPRRTRETARFDHEEDDGDDIEATWHRTLIDAEKMLRQCKEPFGLGSRGAGHKRRPAVRPDSSSDTGSWTSGTSAARKRRRSVARPSSIAAQASSSSNSCSFLESIAPRKRVSAASKKVSKRGRHEKAKKLRGAIKKDRKEKLQRH